VIEEEEETMPVSPRLLTYNVAPLVLACILYVTELTVDGESRCEKETILKSWSPPTCEELTVDEY
jgi:hypothetical protein